MYGLSELLSDSDQCTELVAHTNIHKNDNVFWGKENVKNDNHLSYL